MKPAAEGFRMPAEWAPHAGTWLSWPHDPVTFPDRVPKVEDTYRAIIRALSPHERVHLVCNDAATVDKVQAWLVAERLRNVSLYEIPVADVWFRDYGPIFVTRPGEVAMTKWTFNAWGDKYDTLLPDNGIPYQIQPRLGNRLFEGGMVLEGGSIDVNGAGTLLTTEQCLLNENRNPGLTRSDIEARLTDFLGVRHFLWLGDGIEGDDTDGHIDDITRFVGPSTVVTAVEPDKGDANHEPLAANRKRLSKMTDQDGKPLSIIDLPMPGNPSDDEGRLPMSYANFYIANNVVLAPVFGRPNDRRAISVLEGCFPGRKVVPIRCEDLVWGMGTLHCISQQQPLAPPVEGPGAAHGARTTPPATRKP